MNTAEWDKSFREHKTVIAVENGVIVGSGDMSPDGYPDRLYVHRNFQRRGVALKNYVIEKCPAAE